MTKKSLIPASLFLGGLLILASYSLGVNAQVHSSSSAQNIVSSSQSATSSLQSSQLQTNFSSQSTFSSTQSSQQNQSSSFSSQISEIPEAQTSTSSNSSASQNLLSTIIHPIITEIFYRTANISDKCTTKVVKPTDICFEDKWIEIFNPSDLPIDLSAYKLRTNPSINPTKISNPIILQPQSYTVIKSKLTNLISSVDGLTNVSNGLLKSISKQENSVVFVALEYDNQIVSGRNVDLATLENSKNKNKKNQSDRYSVEFCGTSFETPIFGFGQYYSRLGSSFFGSPGSANVCNSLEIPATNIVQVSNLPIPPPSNSGTANQPDPQTNPGEEPRREPQQNQGAGSVIIVANQTYLANKTQELGFENASNNQKVGQGISSTETKTLQIINQDNFQKAENAQNYFVQNTNKYKYQETNKVATNQNNIIYNLSSKPKKAFYPTNNVVVAKDLSSIKASGVVEKHTISVDIAPLRSYHAIFLDLVILVFLGIRGVWNRGKDLESRVFGKCRNTNYLE